MIQRNVIAPNIFDAHADSEVILPLVLANLLSPKLWEFSARVMQRVPPASAGVAIGDIAPALRQAQRQIDRSFEHLSHERVVELNGEFDLADESQRLGEEAVNGAIDSILATGRWRESRGTFHGTDTLKESVGRGKFPAYYYATFDVVRANRRGVRHRTHAPMGLTSCLDEVAIFAALVMTLPADTVDTVVILASPAHYTAFGWNQAGQPWWFYGKNALLSANDWQALVASQYQGDAQMAFDDRLPHLDRILSTNGIFDFSSGNCSIPPERVEVITEMLDRFFGVRLSQVDRVLKQPRVMSPPSVFAPMFLQLLGTDSLETVRNRIFGCAPAVDEVAVQTVLTSYRSLAVVDLFPFLDAARSSPTCRRLGKTLESVHDALDVLRGVAGRESIFADRGRLAMPEETLRLGTGSDRDVALLLHVLLENMYAAKHQSVRMETLFTDTESFVSGPDFCINTTSLEMVVAPVEGVLIRIAEPLGGNPGARTGS